MPLSKLYRSSDRQRLLEVRSGKEPASWRTAFARDYARLIHSASFRRLQGKTQLFAGLESDFFRNRLTHSLEVAQVATGIGQRLNSLELRERGFEIDSNLLQVASLAHDLGHPPFGHTGEAQLHEMMRRHGGFEGNAQSLRILCRLEKKLDDPEAQIEGGAPVWFRDGRDASYGLNLCSRSLAAIVKYDHEISLMVNLGTKVVKGYYSSERPVMDTVRRNVLGSEGGILKTLECQIMDLADDIAYSTFDIEDAFKGGLLNPLDLLHPSDAILEQVAERAGRELDLRLDRTDIEEVLYEVFGRFATPFDLTLKARTKDEILEWYRAETAASYQTAREFSDDGFYRTRLTSSLIDAAIRSVGIEIDESKPALSRITMKEGPRLRVSVLKHLVYTMLIRSSRFKLVETRGKQVVRTIFEILAENGQDLLPEDTRQRWEQAENDPQRHRVICDYIAGMTDRYAVEFYARLTSDDFHTMFKPV